MQKKTTKTFEPISKERNHRIREEKQIQERAKLDSQRNSCDLAANSGFHILTWTWNNPDDDTTIETVSLKWEKGLPLRVFLNRLHNLFGDTLLEGTSGTKITINLKKELPIRMVLDGLYNLFGDTLIEEEKRAGTLQFAEPLEWRKIRDRLQQMFAE